MSAELLRQAAAEILGSAERSGFYDFHVAVADWLDAEADADEKIAAKGIRGHAASYGHALAVARSLGL